MNDVKLSQVKVGGHVPEFYAKGLLLNGDSSYLWIRNRKNLIGWTYNYNPRCSLVQSFKQLISCLGPIRSNVKLANNVHLKCYIDKKGMLVGSFNLTYPTMVDLCVLVRDPIAINFMRAQFRKHWNSL